MDPLDGTSRPRRFRWRIIPAALLFAYGGALVLAGLWSLAFALYSAVNPRIPGEQAKFLAVQGLMVFSGCLWLASGRWCLHGRWRWAIAGTVLGYLYMAALWRLSPGP